MAQYRTRQYPTRQSLRRTAAAAGVLALVLATAPVVPTLGADGDLTLSSGAAYAKGKGGGRSGHGGPGRGHNGQSGFGEDTYDGHGATFGHSDDLPGVGVGHEKAEGYGHHHDTNYGDGEFDHNGDHDGDHDWGHDGDHEWGHDGDFSDHHSSDPSFSAATDNARRDFGRAKSSAIKAWSDFWN